jgi:hypothetical protein
MSTLRRLTLALVALAIFVSPRPVRGQDVGGTWTAEVPVRIASDGGAEHVEETATVTITLTQTGEVVEGTWQMSALPDRPEPQPRPLRGTVRGGVLVLTDTTTAQVRRGDELPVDVQMINTLELRVEGDELVGTQSARSADGMISSQPREFRATRAR